MEGVAAMSGCPCSVLLSKKTARKIATFLVSFVASFGVALLYQWGQFDYTTSTISFTSAVFGISVAALFTGSRWFRCVMAVSILNCLTTFGVLMLLLFFSWIAWTKYLLSIINNLNSIHTAILCITVSQNCVSNNGTYIDYYKTVIGWTGIAHYCMVLPLFCIPIQTAIYIESYLKSKKRKYRETQIDRQERLDKALLSSKVRRVFNNIFKIFIASIKSLLGGIVIGITLTLVFVQYAIAETFVFDNTIDISHNTCPLQPSYFASNTYVIYFFLLYPFSVGAVILGGFLLHFRKKIVKFFYSDYLKGLKVTRRICLNDISLSRNKNSVPNIPIDRTDSASSVSSLESKKSTGRHRNVRRQGIRNPGIPTRQVQLEFENIEDENKDYFSQEDFRRSSF